MLRGWSAKVGHLGIHPNYAWQCAKDAAACMGRQPCHPTATCTALPSWGQTATEQKPGAACGQGQAGGSAAGQGGAWHWAHWKCCAWSCCSTKRREGGVTSQLPWLTLCSGGAGEELFSIFLCFSFCLFLNWLNTSLAPSHATVPSAIPEGNEAFAAKTEPSASSPLSFACSILPKTLHL